jgi:hypothetical protein
MKIQVTTGNTDAIVKRMMYLAWKACGRAVGMGVFQDRGPDMSEGQVWQAMYEKHDYPSGNKFNDNKPNDVCADYVMGRMMKLGLRWGKDFIDGSDDWDPDYQSFCRKYPDLEALYQAAVTDLTVPK